MIDDIRPQGPSPVQDGNKTENAEVLASAPQASPEHLTQYTATPGQIVTGGSRSWKQMLLWVFLVVLLAAAGAYYMWGRPSTKPVSSTAYTQKQTAAANTKAADTLTLDTSKNYGNKYDNGVLPVGDGKYKTTGAQQGYVYACSGYAQNLAADSGGAGRRGPWFSSDGTAYDINKKAHVAGNVSWQASFSNTVSGSTRTIVTNDLPNHTTGVFPIAASDPAYAYDKNPNKISTQSFTYTLPVTPTYGSPQCMGGQVGVALTGVAIFSGFDAGGRDAGAWEVQDSCSGHPEKSGTYHYHTLSSCIKDISVHAVIGFALDGFPITGPQVSANNYLTTTDLDECHGITSSITLDNRVVTLYHYVMTQDFPYSVSCFRATAIQPPGQQAADVRQHP